MKPHLKQQIDWERYERYCTAHAIAEAIYRWVTAPPKDSASERTRQTERRDPLFEKLDFLSQLRSEEHSAA